MSRSNRRPRYAGGLRHVATTAVLRAIHLTAGARLEDPDLPPDTAATTVPALPESGVPIFLTLGLGYGQRWDRCAYCASAKNTESFTGHVGLGKYVTGGLGVGVDASVWRRSHPGLPGAVDSLGVATPTALLNQLGNVSVSLSFAAWRLFHPRRRGRSDGMAGHPGRQRGRSDRLWDRDRLLPLASLVSLVVFANWNVGSYDLSTPLAVIERGIKHEYIELGFGLTLPPRISLKSTPRHPQPHRTSTSG